MSERNRGLGVLVMVLAVLNLGLVGWIAFGTGTQSPAPGAPEARATRSGEVAMTGAASASSRPAAQPSPSAEAPAPRLEATTAAIPRQAAPIAPAAPVGGPDLTLGEQNLISLFERTSPAVVFITTLQEVRPRFGMNVHRVPQGSGSGFIWDADGHIVTNFHVIANASEAVVTLSDGSEVPATLVGAAPDHDLAVLKIDVPKERLHPIPVGTSRALKVGQFTMAIGNPFGLDQTLTTGVVSALDREIDSISGRRIFGVVQTDAAINPGNSGGPLLDSHGRLIGVNTAIQSPSGASAGIGFAVPVDTVSRVVPQLIKHGKAARPGIGVSLLGEQMAQRFGVRGLVIQAVFPDTPAAEAGLTGLVQDRRGRVRLGDVIVGVDATEVTNYADFQRALDPHAVGDEVVLKLDRDGSRREVKLRLAAVN